MALLIGRDALRSRVIVSMRLDEKKKYYLCFGIVLVLALAIGLGCGVNGGDVLLQRSMFRGGSSPLLFRPAYQYYSIFRFINDGDEMKRLAGYYALLESRGRNDDFLIERYEKEDSPVIKRTIVWILGFSEEIDGILDFYHGIYKNSPESIKRQIEVSLLLQDAGVYRDFMKKEGVPGILSK